MGLKIATTNSIADLLDGALRRKYTVMAAAATAAMGDAGTAFKAEGRAQILTAGLGRKFANALRVNVFPKGGKTSIDAAAFAHHAIPYASVFEEGATIRGKPTLWVPLSSTPKKIGRKRMTPALYAKQIGPLFPLRSKAGKPLLAANIAAGRRNRKDTSKVTLSALRRGTSGSGPTRAVPLFVGLDSVAIRKRMNIGGIAASIRGRLAGLYVNHLRDD